MSRIIITLALNVYKILSMIIFATKETTICNVILGKISDILSEDAIENFAQTLLENSIQATYGN